MYPQLTTKFRLPKWWLFALLSFFIFSAGVPSFAAQQKVPVRTEQQVEKRSIRNFSIVKFYQSVSDVSISFECRFLFNLNSYSSLIDVRLRSRTDKIFMFSSIGINLIANFLPRSGEELSFLNQG